MPHDINAEPRYARYFVRKIHCVVPLEIPLCGAAHNFVHGVANAVERQFFVAAPGSGSDAVDGIVGAAIVPVRTRYIVLCGGSQQAEDPPGLSAGTVDCADAEAVEGHKRVERTAARCSDD